MIQGLTPGQGANGMASAFVAGMGSLFIITYGVLAKWRKTVDGRLMMTFGVAITLTCSLTLTMTVFGFAPGIDILRWVQAGLMGVVGLCFLIYTVRVWRAQVFRRKNYQEKEEFDDVEF